MPDNPDPTAVNMVPVAPVVEEVPPMPPPTDLPSLDSDVPPPSPELSGGAGPTADIQNLGIPPVISPLKPKGRIPGRMVATILGILVLVGGLGAGVVLVRQQQLFQQKAAANCPSGYYACGTDMASCCHVFTGSTTAPVSSCSCGTYSGTNTCKPCGNASPTSGTGNGSSCTPGSSEAQSCTTGVSNLCQGTQNRTCSSDGTWGSWGSCVALPGGCPASCSPPGSSQSEDCNINGGQGTTTRTCSSDGVWESWGSCIPNTNNACSPGSSEAQSCTTPDGQQGTQNATCSSSGTWGSWGSCVALGCTSSAQCGQGQTCTNGQCISSGSCTYSGSPDTCVYDNNICPYFMGGTNGKQYCYKVQAEMGWKYCGSACPNGRAEAPGGYCLTSTSCTWTGGYSSGVRCQDQPDTKCAAPTPTSGPTNQAQCQSILTYDTNWNALTSAQLSSLQAGSMVRFAVSGTASGSTITKAKFIINGVAGAEVTQTKPGTTNVFYEDYTIPSGVTSFTVSAQLYDSVSGWF